MSDRLPLGDIITDLKTDASALVKDNVALAKAELTPIAKNAGIGAGLFSAAGVLGLWALTLLLLCAAFALSLLAGRLFNLSLLLNLVIGFGTLGVLLLIVVSVLALVGKGRLAKVGPPTQTINEAKATIAALGDSVKRGQADVKALSQQQSGKPAARRALS